MTLSTVKVKPLRQVGHTTGPRGRGDHRALRSRDIPTSRDRPVILYIQTGPVCPHPRGGPDVPRGPRGRMTTILEARITTAQLRPANLVARIRWRWLCCGCRGSVAGSERSDFARRPDMPSEKTPHATSEVSTEIGEVRRQIRAGHRSRPLLERVTLGAGAVVSVLHPLDARRRPYVDPSTRARRRDHHPPYLKQTPCDRPRSHEILQMTFNPMESISENTPCNVDVQWSCPTLDLALARGERNVFVS